MSYQIFYRKKNVIVLSGITILISALIVYLFSNRFFESQNSNNLYEVLIIAFVFFFPMSIFWTIMLILEIIMNIPYISICDDHINFRLSTHPLKGQDFYFEDIEYFEMNYKDGGSPDLLIFLKKESKEKYNWKNPVTIIYHHYVKWIVGDADHIFSLNYLDYSEEEIMKMIEEKFTNYQKEHSEV